MPLFIAGAFKDRGQAQRVFTALKAAGVPETEVSLVVREVAEEDVTIRPAMLDAGDPSSAYAGQSAWDRLGWQGGARPPYRNTVAPQIEMAFLAAGPVAVAIGGAQIGAAAGGIVGAMANFGFTLETARKWYEGIQGGQAWMMVRTTPKEASRAREVFERYQPADPAESLRHW